MGAEHPHRAYAGQDTTVTPSVFLRGGPGGRGANIHSPDIRYADWGLDIAPGTGCVKPFGTWAELLLAGPHRTVSGKDVFRSGADQFEVQL
ncbi:hypothetical protein JTB14_016253 [Gonioctena quinquepunctata]|nr:hypothetical protein JTB14_016253 [Gonioctena quinquepunctata]